jgi:hypothetical protein
MKDAVDARRWRAWPECAVNYARSAGQEHLTGRALSRAECRVLMSANRHLKTMADTLDRKGVVAARASAMPPKHPGTGRKSG